MTKSHLGVVYFGSCRKTKKTFGGKQLGATSKCWLLLGNFVIFERFQAWNKHFSSWSLLGMNVAKSTSIWESLPIANQQSFSLMRHTWASLLGTIKKLLCDCCFYCFQPCESLARNTTLLGSPKYTKHAL